MTEEIIKSITEAEEKATDMKTAAYARAAEIAAQAEIRAEEVCKAYRETQLKAAEADAQKKYLAALAEKRAEAEAYAARLLENTELPVSKIVRRVCGGDC